MPDRVRAREWVMGPRGMGPCGMGQGRAMAGIMWMPIITESAISVKLLLKSKMSDIKICEMKTIIKSILIGSLMGMSLLALGACSKNNSYY